MSDKENLLEVQETENGLVYVGDGVDIFVNEMLEMPKDYLDKVLEKIVKEKDGVNVSLEDLKEGETTVTFEPDIM